MGSATDRGTADVGHGRAPAGVRDVRGALHADAGVTDSYDMGIPSIGDSARLAL